MTLRKRRQRESESVFLARRAAEAQLAIQATLGDVSRETRGLADVRNWFSEFPKSATGVSILAGGVLGFLLPSLWTKSPKQRRRTRAFAGRKNVRPWVSRILRAVSGTLSPIVLRLITTALRSAKRPAEPPVMHEPHEADVEQTQSV